MRRTVSVLFVLLLASGAAFAAPPVTPPPTFAPNPPPSPKIEKVGGGMAWSAFATNMNDAAGAAARQWISTAVVTAAQCRGSQLSLAGNALENRAVDVYTLVHDSLVDRGAREAVAFAVARGFALTWVGWAFGFTVTADNVFSDFATLAPASCRPGRTTPAGRDVPLNTGSTPYPLTAASLRSAIVSQLNTFPASRGVMSEPGADAAIAQFASTFETRFNAWFGRAKLQNLTCDARGAFGDKPNIQCAGSVSAARTLDAAVGTF